MQMICEQLHGLMRGHFYWVGSDIKEMKRSNNKDTIILKQPINHPRNSGIPKKFLYVFMS